MHKDMEAFQVYCRWSWLLKQILLVCIIYVMCSICGCANIIVSHGSALLRSNNTLLPPLHAVGACLTLLLPSYYRLLCCII